MRLALALAALLALVGCASQTGTDSPTASPAAASPAAAADASNSTASPAVTPGASPEATAADASPAATPYVPTARATLTVAQVKKFVPVLAARAGHGGWSPEEVAAAEKQILAVPKGSKQTGSIHMDYNGRHLDLTMTIFRRGEDQVEFEFTGPIDSLMKDLQQKLDNAKK